MRTSTYELAADEVDSEGWNKRAYAEDSLVEIPMSVDNIESWRFVSGDIVTYRPRGVCIVNLVYIYWAVPPTGVGTPESQLTNIMATSPLFTYYMTVYGLSGYLLTLE
ncbi:hypothetical protein F5Y12DRAFT_181798 [Xylaria sp. FL1777]|nr:hypothetical protein F5Y12DRAFT_181798 [Xylaria sp. FL1777]